MREGEIAFSVQSGNLACTFSLTIWSIKGVAQLPNARSRRFLDKLTST